MNSYQTAMNMLQNAAIIAFIAKLTFVLASTFTRLSLLLFYYRLIRDSGIKWFHWVLHASLAFNITVGVTFGCFAIFLCE